MTAPSKTAFALVAILVTSAVLAGCLGPGDPGEKPVDPGPDAKGRFHPEWWLHAIPMEGHSHTDVEQHRNLSTPNFQLLGWDPLLTEYKGKGSAGGYFCGDVASTKEGRRFAVVHSFTTDVAFVIADVTDPTKPMTVGEYILENAHVYDVALTTDGLHVIVGTDPTDTGPDESPTTKPILEAVEGDATKALAITFKDACTGETRRVQGPEQKAPFASGALLVGIKDPKNPVFEDFRPLPILGPHSVSTAEVGGKQLAIASVTNLVHSATYFHFLEVQDTPLGPKLVMLSTYQAPPQPAGSLPVTNGHVDASIQKHPITNKVYAYLANWDAGVVIVDITDPRTPTYVSSWTDFKGGLGFFAGDDAGAIHEALPIEGLWDGKHYVIAGQELGGHPKGRPTGWVNIIDTTDPTKPTLAGRWTLPFDVSWKGFLMFSPHYVEIVNRTLFVTLYHGGVWAVDLSTPEKIAAPPSIGVFIPDQVSPRPPKAAGGMDWTPIVLDVLGFPDGTLAVFDGTSGVYMIRFDDTDPAPSPPVWPGSEVKA
ncbi:MAG TPA: hypothetical protein VM889_02715 [Candidatus Thermoplasmatota archaeon]|nr:hypothetical protein [Candidatus Thermoplasmatota archaeon]